MRRFILAALALLLASAAQAQVTQRYIIGPSVGEQIVNAGAYIAGVNAQTGTTYTVLASDAGKVVTLSNAAAVAVTLPQAGTTGFETNKFWALTNKGVGLVTVTPTTSNISGLSTVVLATGDSLDIVSDGTNYQIQGGQPSGRVCTASGATPQTCNAKAGLVTTASLTTAALTAAASYVINNSTVTTASVVSCSVMTYSGTLQTNGTPHIGTCVAGAGTITVIIVNVHTTAALSGTVGIAFNVQN